MTSHTDDLEMVIRRMQKALSALCNSMRANPELAEAMRRPDSMRAAIEKMIDASEDAYVLMDRKGR